jgi:hypothetical protein
MRMPFDWQVQAKTHAWELFCEYGKISSGQLMIRTDEK